MAKPKETKPKKKVINKSGHTGAKKKPKPEDKPLTPMQEAFVLEFALTGKKSKSYFNSYETDKTGGALATAAHAAFDKPNMEKRYQEVLAQCNADYVVTKETLAKEFDDAAEFARSHGHSAALSNALKNKAKLYGRMVDVVQQEVTGPQGAPLFPAEVKIMVIHVDKPPDDKS